MGLQTHIETPITLTTDTTSKTNLVSPARWDLEYIEQYFLAKDLDMGAEGRRKTELVETAGRVDREIEMTRKRQKDSWGVTMGHTFRSVKDSQDRDSQTGSNFMLDQLERRSLIFWQNKSFKFKE